MSEDIPCPLGYSNYPPSPLAYGVRAVTGNKRKCYNYADFFINWGLKINQDCLNESNQWKIPNHKKAGGNHIDETFIGFILQEIEN